MHSAFDLFLYPVLSGAERFYPEGLISNRQEEANSIVRFELFLVLITIIDCLCFYFLIFL